MPTSRAPGSVCSEVHGATMKHSAGFYHPFKRVVD
jgi:hypothetical protein